MHFHVFTKPEALIIALGIFLTGALLGFILGRIRRRFRHRAIYPHAPTRVVSSDPRMARGYPGKFTSND